MTWCQRRRKVKKYSGGEALIIDSLLLPCSLFYICKIWRALAPLPPCFRRPCMYFELLNEPDINNYYKYLEVIKKSTLKRMTFNRKIAVLFTNHLKKLYYSAIFAFATFKKIIKTNLEFVGRFGEQLIIVQISKKKDIKRKQFNKKGELFAVTDYITRAKVC